MVVHGLQKDALPGASWRSVCHCVLIWRHAVDARVCRACSGSRLFLTFVIDAGTVGITVIYGLCPLPSGSTPAKNVHLLTKQMAACAFWHPWSQKLALVGE